MALLFTAFSQATGSLNHATASYYHTPEERGSAPSGLLAVRGVLREAAPLLVDSSSGVAGSAAQARLAYAQGELCEVVHAQLC